MIALYNNCTQSSAIVGNEFSSNGLSKAQPSLDEIIIIPEEARECPLSSFSVSVRLAHVLEYKGFQTLGDLHGLPFAAFSTYRNCGRKTVDELRMIISTVQDRRQPSSATSSQIIPLNAVQAGTFYIPANIFELNPFELPISARLEGVFKNEEISRFGDLHDVSIRQFLELRNCGRKTVDEIFRLLRMAGTGEFSFPAGEKVEVRLFAEYVDAYFVRLKHLVRYAVVLRYGGNSSNLLTLEQVGDKLKVTRERIRQICVVTLQKLLRAYGLKMRQLGAELISISKAQQRSIEWSDIAVPDQQYTYHKKFYCRLLKELFPDLNVAGVKTRSARLVFSTYGEEIKQIETNAELRLGHYTVADAYQEYSGKFHFVGIGEFSEILLQSGRLEIRELNERLIVYPRWINKLRVLKDILEHSEKPQTSKIIYNQFKALHVAHGFKNYPGFHRIHTLLTETPGIFYFGKNLFGLEKHLHVRREQWPDLVSDFEAHCRMA